MDTASLLATTGGNRALLRELARLCLHEDAPRLRAQLNGAVRAGDAAGIECAAHALKGLVAEFRAEAARAAAGEIEATARAGKSEAITAQLRVFEEEFAKLEALLQTILDEPA
jgi:HPt (histidine-containing phosphotransfer) domain-containing protein